MPSLVLEATWANAGATVIIYLAALTGVNRELYEAASVDGASLWRKVWHITLPQLRGVLLVTMILQIIGTAQVFLEPYLFTSGGPANATLTVLLLIYDYAFGELARRRLRQGDRAEPDAGRLPRAVLARLLARDALVEHGMSPSERARTVDHVERLAAASSPSPSGTRLASSGASARCSCSCSSAARHRRPRADPVARQVGDHADRRTRSRNPMSLFPHGTAWSNLRSGLDRRPRRPLLLEHGRRLRSARGSCRSSSQRPAGTCCRCCGRRYARHRSARCCSRRSSSRRSSCSSRSTSRSSDPPLDPPLVHRQLLGDLAARRRERVQRHPREALLRQPAARDLRGGARSTAPGRSGCSGRSCCRCRSRSSASSRCSPCSRRGRTSSGRCSSSPNPDKQPLSVRLPTIQSQTELGVFLAAMFIACLVPIVGFLIFQRLVPARHRPRRRDQGLTARPAARARERERLSAARTRQRLRLALAVRRGSRRNPANGAATQPPCEALRRHRSSRSNAPITRSNEGSIATRAHQLCFG